MLYKRTLDLKDKICPEQATIYKDDEVDVKACILYFHGGGLLYGSREDLPERHIHTLTQAGYAIIAFDYPLSPAAKIDLIKKDVCDSVNHYAGEPSFYFPELADSPLPYYIWGRSAGAYLCLIAAASGNLKTRPAGVLSYYGYGFLCDNWFNNPSNYYRTLPWVPESCLQAIPSEIHSSGDLDTHYSVYVYARQTGLWKSLFYEGREKFFFLDYSLRVCDQMPCPLFCAHSMNDTDVPYSEFLELCGKYNAKRFIASKNMHDFDRMEDEPDTIRLLDATIQFMEVSLAKYRAFEKL